MQRVIMLSLHRCSLDRDAKLSALEERADALQDGSAQFEKRAGSLKNKFWMENLKSMIMMGVVGLILLGLVYFMVSREILAIEASIFILALILISNFSFSSPTRSPCTHRRRRRHRSSCLHPPRGAEASPEEGERESRRGSKGEETKMPGSDQDLMTNYRLDAFISCIYFYR